jgi:hypothetical protein
MEIYRDEGGIRYGTSHWASSNATWPSANLVVTPEKISLKYNALFDRNEFEFKKEEVLCLYKKNGFLPFNKGLIIEHMNPHYPVYILFWTFGWKKLESALNSMGYDVKRLDFGGNAKP